MYTLLQTIWNAIDEKNQQFGIIFKFRFFKQNMKIKIAIKILLLQNC